MTPPSCLIGKYYKVDPLHEGLIGSKGLRDGMVVLIKDCDRREDTSGNTTEYQKHRAQWMNRWSRIRKVSIDESMEMVTFESVYSDRTVKLRWYKLDVEWIVKLDSMIVEAKR